MSFETSEMDTELIFRKDGDEMRVLADRCLVTGFKVKDWQVLYRPTETKNLMRAGLPLMIPNFSSLRGDKTFIETGTKLPHHGFGRLMKWTVEKPRDDGVSCYIENDAETMKQYPFKFRFRMNATLLGGGRMKHESIIENLDDKVLPVQPGLHPYFTCPFEDKPKVEVDFEGFKAADWTWKTKETCPDYNVPFNKKATIKFPSLGTLELIEEPEEGDQYHYRRMQIWSEPEGAKDYKFICFEPVVWPADGLNDPKTRLNIPVGGKATLTLILKALPNC